MQRQRLPQRIFGSSEACGDDLRAGHQVQGPALAWPIVGLARGRQGCLVQGESLVPVVPAAQEAVHGGGDQHGMHGQLIGRRILGGCVQVGALALQPGGGLP